MEFLDGLAVGLGDVGRDVVDVVGVDGFLVQAVSGSCVDVENGMLWM